MSSSAVVPNSPAEEAGLKTHDVLTDVDAQPITGQGQLIEAVQQAGKGQRALTLALIRAGTPQTITVKPARHRESERVLRWQHGGDVIPALPDSVPGRQFLPDGTGIVPTPDDRLRDWMQEQTRAQEELKQQIEQLRRDIDELRTLLQAQNSPE